MLRAQAPEKSVHKHPNDLSDIANIATRSGFGHEGNASASPVVEDEPEVITDFSWRNFFSVINFVHVLQKLTKRKAHRILLLVQYKSSVSQSYPRHK